MQKISRSCIAVTSLLSFNIANNKKFLFAVFSVPRYFVQIISHSVATNDRVVFSHWTKIKFAKDLSGVNLLQIWNLQRRGRICTKTSKLSYRRISTGCNIFTPGDSALIGGGCLFVFACFVRLISFEINYLKEISRAKHEYLNIHSPAIAIVTAMTNKICCYYDSSIHF